MIEKMILKKLQQFLSEEKELQKELAVAVADVNREDVKSYLNLSQDYQLAKGRVLAIQNTIELVEDVINKQKLKEHC